MSLHPGDFAGTALCCSADNAAFGQPGLARLSQKAAGGAGSSGG